MVFSTQPTLSNTSSSSIASSDDISEEDSTMRPSLMNTSAQSIYLKKMGGSAKNLSTNVTRVASKTMAKLEPLKDKIVDRIEPEEDDDSMMQPSMMNTSVHSIYLKKMGGSAKNVVRVAGKTSAKLEPLKDKIADRIEPSVEEILSSDRRRIELIALLFSAVFLFAALATRSKSSPTVPAPFTNVAPPLTPGEYPAPPSPTEPQTVPVPPTFPPVLPLVPDAGQEPEEEEQDVDTAHDDETLNVASTYIPGDLTITENGLLLSTGLQSRIIGQSGMPVVNIYGEVSPHDFHPLPDAGACFANPNGDGGWVYVSNSEEDDGKGGVGGIYFDASGNVLAYKRLLDGTTDNCGGGKTPWGTWISLEENSDKGTGIWEVHPFYERPSSLTALAERKPGMYESFAYDIRNPFNPKFFFTEDKEDGTLRRFSPNTSSVSTDQNTMWRMLYDDGYKHEYLVLNPSVFTNEKPIAGTFSWTDNIEEGRTSAFTYYRFTEGIDCRDGMLFFISKEQRELFALDLDKFTFTVSSTEHGAFAQPDQIVSIFPSQRAQPRVPSEDKNIIYFTEDGGSSHSGIHARDMQGRYFTILESVTEIVDQDETTGLAFSPDRRHLYFALQKNGSVFDVWRQDGKPFGGMHLDIKYHATSNVNRRR